MNYDQTKEVNLDVLTLIIQKDSSLFKKELFTILGKKHSKNDIERAIQELTLTQYIVGATNLSAAKQADEPEPLKKREVKAKIKEESKIDPADDSVPLTINYYKFLLEEKKQNILQLARVKLPEA